MMNPMLHCQQMSQPEGQKSLHSSLGDEENKPGPSGSKISCTLQVKSEKTDEEIKEEENIQTTSRTKKRCLYKRSSQLGQRVNFKMKSAEKKEDEGREEKKIQTPRRKRRCLFKSVKSKKSDDESRYEEKKQKPSRSKILCSVKVKCEKIDFEYEQSTCRVCLKEGHIPIYGRVDVSKELNIFTGLEITPDDTYPQYLCESCNSLLESAILLRKTAQNSDQLLKQAKQNKNDDTEYVEIEIEPVEDNKGDDWWKSSEENALDYDEESRKKKLARALDKKGKTKEDKLQDLLREIDATIDGYKEANVKFEEVRRKTFHCLKCNLDFDTMADYSAHRLAAKHDNLRLNCPICNNSYIPKYLKGHLALHKKEKPYMCDVCGNKFATHGQCTKHRLTHFIDDLPFKCSVCPYRGRFKEYLKVHMKTHTNDRRYQCPQCPTRYFISKSNLSKHMFTHKADHDFKCSQCPRGFYTKRNLELHVKVDHHGIKDHICNFCGKAFGFRKQMMAHERNVHKRENIKKPRHALYVKLDSKKQNEERGMHERSDDTRDFEKTTDNIDYNLNDTV